MTGARIFAALSLLLVAMPLPITAETTAQSHSPASAAGEWIDEPQVTTTVKHVPLGKFGAAKVKVDDFGREPVGAGVEISVELNCGRKKFSIVEPTLRACKFKSVHFDAASSRLVVKYQITESVNGRSKCVKDDSFDYSIATLCRK